MGSGKQGTSETSSEENDRQEQVQEGATITTTSSISSKRSYECTFCKRGFTNAQALGGHMNIHRKDRAKTKPVTAGSSISGTTNEKYMNPNHMGPISYETMNYYPVLEAQRNYPMNFHPSGSSIPRLTHCYYHGNDLHVPPRHQSLSMNEELWGANLSLQIDSNHLEDKELNREVSKQDEVDLELRLGHDR
ncbi:hypothetical protein P3X46_027559 [Hevea brasiliensis]|uniref:C2H2-type domain-containing protein n=1 Tax=Hevea brasiliensis TaxID=3981 RepID=A0ABQ9L0D3_HEVBR|nr:zinc finger protein 10-like [Hevea brasiliensis]KAJ9154197.1 hypothetical protein P3X46_027559 [Hevea brasiliensis]